MSFNNQLSKFTLEQMKEFIEKVCPFSWEINVEKTEHGFNFTHQSGEQIAFFPNTEIAGNAVVYIESWLYNYRAEMAYI
jgi:hypothetical protein